MAKDRLVVDGENYAYYLRWYLPDESDYGCTIGEDKMPSEPSPDDVEKWENWCAYKVASESRGANPSSAGYFWESKSLAVAALAAIKHAWRNSRPLADWEQKAIAAGWKPPRGAAKK